MVRTLKVEFGAITEDNIEQVRSRFPFRRRRAHHLTTQHYIIPSHHTTIHATTATKDQYVFLSHFLQRGLLQECRQATE